MNARIAAALLFAVPAYAQKSDADKMRQAVKEAVNPKADPDNPPPDVDKMPFSSDSVKRVVAHYQPKIQACYEETLAEKEKALEGKLVTSWVITTEGMVKNARIDKKASTLKEPKLHECVVAVLATMTFPRPARDQPVSFPFNLKPEK